MYVYPTCTVCSNGKVSLILLSCVLEPKDDGAKSTSTGTDISSLSTGITN